MVLLTTYISPYWVPERNLFKIASMELTPTLEEWSPIFGLGVDESCARVTCEYMRLHLMTDLGLTQSALDRVLDG